MGEECLNLMTKADCMSQRVEFAQKTACEKVEDPARFNDQVRGNFNRRKRAYDKDMLLRICCRTCMRTRLPILVPRGVISLFPGRVLPFSQDGKGAKALVVSINYQNRESKG